MALSETLKNILETMATSPFQDEAGVAGVAESGSTALTMTSTATPEVERGCGSVWQCGTCTIATRATHGMSEACGRATS